MANVYVEPKPKGRPEGSAITHYVLEYKHGGRVTDLDHPSQAAAIDAAKRLGHPPLVAPSEKYRQRQTGSLARGVVGEVTTSL